MSSVVKDHPRSCFTDLRIVETEEEVFVDLTQAFEFVEDSRIASCSTLVQEGCLVVSQEALACSIEDCFDLKGSRNQASGSSCFVLVEACHLEDRILNHQHLEEFGFRLG